MNQITKKIFLSYKNFFDKTIENSTITIALICIVLFSVWFFVNNIWAFSLDNSLKANILEIKKEKKEFNIIIIDWKKYKLVLVK